MEKFDILLVNPGGTRKKIYQDLSRDFSGVEPPSWTLLTAGFLKKHGFSVQILDANALGMDIKETVDFIEGIDARWTGVLVFGQQANTSTPLMTGIGKLLKAIRKNNPGRKIILSGWHPSALPEETFNEEACDYLIEGEGFYAYLGLLENRKLNEIPGLWYRENGKSSSHNPRAKNIENLTEELSELPWELLPMEKYRSFNWHSLPDLDSRGRYASIYTSLGCPFICKFCCINTPMYMERRIRYWEVDWVLKQLDILAYKYNVRNIKINDEMFNLNPNHYLKIAEGLLKRDYKLNVACFARVDAIKKEYLSILKKAGFNWFELGIESGNKNVLEKAAKGKYRSENIKECVKNIHEAGIDLCANFIFGLPGDTMETMEETLNLCFEMMPAFPSFFCAMAPPGSKLYEEAKEKGLRLPEIWEGYAQQGYDFVPLPNENLTSEQILKFRDDAFNRYFRNPAYLSMIEKKFGLRARKHIEEMNKIDLKRKILGD